MKLVAPTIAYKDSFLAAVLEFQTEDLHDRVDYNELDIEKITADFPSYVTMVNSQARGENLPEGWVPATTFWLIDKGEFIGRVSIRHRLTPHLLQEGGHIGYDIRKSMRRKGYGEKILQLALQEAKKLGLEKVLITCDETNIASKKIIEVNGGILENLVEKGDGKVAKLRYWITL